MPGTMLAAKEYDPREGINSVLALFISLGKSQIKGKFIMSNPKPTEGNRRSDVHAREG